jgi:uncharacterized DUF497 family protein
MRFEWDPAKDKANQDKHGLSFDEAAELLKSGVDYVEIYEREHSGEEDRFIAVGPIRRGVVVVVYVESQDDVFRIVSARLATKRESQRFQEYLKGKHG